MPANNRVFKVWDQCMNMTVHELKGVGDRTIDVAKRALKTMSEYIERGCAILYADTDGFYVEFPETKLISFIEFET